MRTVAVVALLLATACGLDTAAPPPRPAPAAGAGALVAVLPFRVGGFLDPAGRYVTDPSVGPIADDLGREIAERLAADLAATGTRVVPAATVLEASPVAGAALYDAKLAARVASAVGADVGVLGAVRRYIQREGTALSVERPATVEYQAMLVAADTGRVLGTYLFDFTQQPLAADLTTLPDFIQGGGKWRTREDILDRSLVKTAAKMASALRGRGQP
jgi:hypothetical protein